VADHDPAGWGAARLADVLAAGPVDGDGAGRARLAVQRRQRRRLLQVARGGRALVRPAQDHVRARDLPPRIDI